MSPGAAANGASRSWASQQPVALLGGQHVGMALQRGQPVRHVLVHRREQRELAGIGRQRGVQVGQHRDAVGGVGRPVGIRRRPRRERHRQTVAHVRSGRQLTAVADHRCPDGLQVVGHRHLARQPVGDTGPDRGGPGRDPGHHRRRREVDLHRELVVEHHGLVDAQPVLAGDRDGRRDRPPRRSARRRARSSVGSGQRVAARDLGHGSGAGCGQRPDVRPRTSHGRADTRRVLLPCASSTASPPIATSPTTTCSSSPAGRRWPRGSTSISPRRTAPAPPFPSSRRT